MSKAAINTKYQVRFYDDRGKSDDLILTDILFENDDICLCHCAWYNSLDKSNKPDDNLILFNKITCEVLTKNFPAYYAENLSVKDAVVKALRDDAFTDNSKKTDLSDVGNIIGIAIAPYLTGDMGFDKDSILHGIKHGISLIDGTHPKL